MMHPLHDSEVDRLLHGAGEDMDRRTGRTTAIALRTIADSIENPYKKMIIYDHYGGEEGRLVAYMTIKDIIIKLGLREMYLDRAFLTLTFGKIK